MTFVDIPAVYSWWIDPIVERHTASGEIDFGFTEHQGRMKVAQCGGDDFRVIRDKVCLTITTPDDHNALSPKRLPDGRLLVTYTNHALDTTLRYRISTDGSVANLGSEQTLTASAAATYSQLHTRSNVLFWFSRIGPTSWALRQCLDTTQASLTFEAERKIVENTANSTQVYCLMRRISNDVLRVFSYRHPSSSGNDLKTFDINLSTGLVYSGSTEYGFLDGSAASGGATLPADFDELPTMYDVGASDTIRFLDASDDGTRVAIGKWPTADNTAAEYKVLKLTGADVFNPAHWTSIDVVACGISFYSTSTYLAGVAFARESHSGIRIYLCRENAGTYYAERWDSASGNGGDWVTTILSQSTTEYLLRPIAVRNPGDIVVIWQRGPIGTYTSYDNFRHFFVTGQAA